MTPPKTLPPSGACTSYYVILLFLLFFSILVLLPAVATFVPLERVAHFLNAAPLDEHRNRVQAPGANVFLSQGGQQFSDALNRWVDDHVGLRDLFIRLKNQIDYSVLGVSRRVYIGEEGWLFEKDTTNDRLAFERLDDEAYASVERAFVSLSEALRYRGVRLVIVSYPDKSAMYPEFLPANIPALPSQKIRRLKQFLDRMQGVIFIDAQNVITRHKGEGEKYYKTDIHPNMVGSIAVAREIVRRIAIAEDRPEFAWRDNVKFFQQHSSGGSESRYLALMRERGEEIPNSNDVAPIGKDTPTGRWIMNDPRRLELPGEGSFPVFDFAFESTPEACAKNLPGMVLFGNSFSDLFWSLGLQNYFCFMRRARTPRPPPPAPTQRLLPFLDDMPMGTKYFIYQFVEAYMPGETPRLNSTKSY